MSRAFNDDSNKRIIRAVLRDEGRRPPPVGVQGLPQQSGPFCIIGQTSGGIAKGSSNAVTVYGGTDSGCLAPLSPARSIIAYSRFATIGTGTMVCCTHFPWGWEVTAAECPGVSASSSSCSSGSG